MLVILLLAFLCNLKIIYSQQTGIQPNAKPGCCALEWTAINYTDALPSDAVFGGHISVKKYAYVYYGGYLIGIKSELTGEKGRGMFYNDWLETNMKVMRNPNNCVLGWYKTRHAYENETSFRSLEAAHGWNFVRANFSAKYPYSNYFTSYSGAPGGLWGVDGYHYYYTDINKERAEYDGPGIGVLYVDCNTSRIELILKAIEFNETALNGFQRQVIYLNTTFINNSSSESTTFYNINASTADSVLLTVNEFKLEKWTFSEAANKSISKLDKQLGVQMHELINSLAKQTTVERNSNPRKFNMSAPLKLNPNSITKVLVSANALTGNLPIKLIFEMKPANFAYAARWLFELLKIAPSTELHVVDRVIQIVVNGNLKLDTGYHLRSDIERVPLQI